MPGTRLPRYVAATLHFARNDHVFLMVKIRGDTLNCERHEVARGNLIQVIVDLNEATS